MQNILNQVLKWEREKGVSNDPADLGGLTNDGITYENYERLAREVLNIAPTVQHFKSMSASEILRFYERSYTRLRMNQLSHPKLRAVAFDFMFNSGFGCREIQEVCNEMGEAIATDNRFGPQTIGALNRLYAIHGDSLIELIIAHRITYVKSLVFRMPNQIRFIRGWMNRIVDLRQFISTL